MKRKFCSQCGQPYDAPSCGPTHAIVAAECDECGGDHFVNRIDEDGDTVIDVCRTCPPPRVKP